MDKLPRPRLADAPSFSVQVVVVDDGADVVVGGELDLATAPDLADALTTVLRALDPASRVAVDLGGTTFVDSSGLAVLVAAHRAATARGQRVVLSGAQPQVRRVLEVTGVSQVLPSVDGAAPT